MERDRSDSRRRRLHRPQADTIGCSGDTSTPQVVVSDLAMADNEGFVFIQELRALEPERRSRFPAIALIGYANAEDRRRALAAGFDQHLAKPIDRVALAEAVARAVRESAA